jgi:hypothetical protein
MVYFIIQKSPIEPVAEITQSTDDNNDYPDSKLSHVLRISNLALNGKRKTETFKCRS